MAVRNLCEGNAEAQLEIASYQRQPEAAAADAGTDAREGSHPETVSCIAPLWRSVPLGIFVFLFCDLARLKLYNMDTISGTRRT